ncbi:MAG: response regulator [Bacteroidota bacterium]
MSTPLTILLIEDSPDDRYFFRRLLEMRPGVTYQVVEAETCETGIELAHAHAPACILLDYILPDAEGFRVLEALQSPLGRPAYPAVVLTGLEELPLATTLPALGATALLSKQRAKLPTTVYRAIDGSQRSFRHLASGSADSSALLQHWQEVHLFGYRLGALSANGLLPRDAHPYLATLEHRRRRLEQEAIGLLHEDVLSDHQRGVLAHNQALVETLIGAVRGLAGEAWWPATVPGSLV